MGANSNLLDVEYIFAIAPVYDDVVVSFPIAKLLF